MFPVADQVPLDRVVHLCGGQGLVGLVAGVAAHDQHPAIEEPYRGVTGARRSHRPGGDPEACWARYGGRGRACRWSSRFALAVGLVLGPMTAGWLAPGVAAAVGVGGMTV